MEFFNKITFLVTGWIFLAALTSVLILFTSFLGKSTHTFLIDIKSGQKTLNERIDNLETRFNKEILEIKNDIKEIKDLIKSSNKLAALKS